MWKMEYPREKTKHESDSSHNKLSSSTSWFHKLNHYNLHFSVLACHAKTQSVQNIASTTDIFLTAKLLLQRYRVPLWRCYMQCILDDWTQHCYGKVRDVSRTSSVQFKMVSKYVLRKCALAHLSDVSQRCLWNCSNVGLIDDGPFSLLWIMVLSWPCACR